MRSKRFTQPKLNRTAVLFFDENDEMEERATPEGDEGSGPYARRYSFPGKEKQKRFRWCKSSVVVNLGSEEYARGVKKITSNIFESKDKTRNAETFINNLNRTKATYIEKKQ